MQPDKNADPRSWTAASIDEPRRWYYPLPDACLNAFAHMRRQPRSESLTATELPATLRSACTEALAPVLKALEAGRGFAIVEGPENEKLSIEDATLLYWLVGQGLGKPFAQNVEGTLLYDVRDTGQDLAKGARFSVTNYESSFHTDNSFGSDVLDYVGLLCLQVAKSGGRSQVLSGFALHQELAARHPEVLATLRRPFHVDRRGGVRPGESATIEFPVISDLPSKPQGSGYLAQGLELLIRYLRYWIEAGHEKLQQPLSTAQKNALDTLDEVMKKPELRVEFDLKPGQMYFINNRWILHNRTAFEDHPDLERRRHLVRLWLQRREPEAPAR